MDSQTKQDQKQEQTPEEVKGEEELKDDQLENDPFKPPDLSKDEEANLAQFLQKIQKACADDKSVPMFVGSQVDDWLKEINDKQGAPVIDAEAIPSNEGEQQ